MTSIKTYAISFFFLALLCSVTGHNDIDQKEEPNIFGPRIIGGSNASLYDRPYQVAIRRKDYNAHWCGGSIIDSEHILTAGHCVKGLSSAELVVFAGVLNNTQESSEDTKVVRQVTEVFVHEDYDRETWKNDIALLKVSPSFPEDNPAVKPIPLRENDVKDDVQCTVSGWGLLRKEPNVAPQILQVAIAYSISQKTCRHTYYSNERIEPGMICADNIQEGQRSCDGDSGGPLVCERLLTGVVSWGHANCTSSKYPNVYTDVVYYKEWIQRQMRKVKDEF